MKVRNEIQNFQGVNTVRKVLFKDTFNIGLLSKIIFKKKMVKNDFSDNPSHKLLRLLHILKDI